MLRRKRQGAPQSQGLLIALAATTLVACTGSKIAKETELIAREKTKALAAIDAGDIDELAGAVGMIGGAENRIGDLGAEPPSHPEIAKALETKWSDIEVAMLASHDAYSRRTIGKFFAGTSVAPKLSELETKISARPRLLVRGASYDSAPQIVRLYQKSHPRFTWLAAEGKRSEDKKKKVDLILDFREETKANQVAAYEKVDAAGKQIGGQKRHALTGYGLKLSVHFVQLAAPEGVEAPTVYRSSEVLDQPKTFRGSGKTSAESKFLEHQANALTGASSKMHAALTSRFLTELAPRLW